MKRLRGPDQSFPEGRPRPNPLSVADLGGAALLIDIDDDVVQGTRLP